MYACGVRLIWDECECLYRRARIEELAPLDIAYVVDESLSEVV
jgi:hypothetical protein